MQLPLPRSLAENFDPPHMTDTPHPTPLATARTCTLFFGDQLGELNQDTRRERGVTQYAFQFNGCCRGTRASTWAEIREAKTHQSCEDLCSANSTCHAIEVNGCNATDAACTGACWHFYGNTTGTIINGQCAGVPVGDQKCFAKSAPRRRVVQCYEKRGGTVGAHSKFQLLDIKLNGNNLSDTIWGNLSDTILNQPHGGVQHPRPFDYLRTTLVSLDLSGNQLGYIPVLFTAEAHSKNCSGPCHSLTRDSVLETLLLRSNQITTVHSASITALPNLQYLDLSGNPLWAINPSALEALGQLARLVIGNGDIYGTRPSYLSRSPRPHPVKHLQGVLYAPNTPTLPSACCCTTTCIYPLAGSSRSSHGAATPCRIAFDTAHARLGRQADEWNHLNEFADETIDRVKSGSMLSSAKKVKVCAIMEFMGGLGIRSELDRLNNVTANRSEINGSDPRANAGEEEDRSAGTENESDDVTGLGPATIAGIICGVLVGLIGAAAGAAVLRRRRRLPHLLRASREEFVLCNLVLQKVQAEFLLGYRQLIRKDVNSFEDYKIEISAFEVAASQIKLGVEIGRGNYGCVFLAELKKDAKQNGKKGAASLTIAVKVSNKTHGTVKSSSEKENARRLDENAALLLEAFVLHGLRHPRIVSLVAVVTQSWPVMICLEHMENGDLRSYLRKCRPSLKTPKASKAQNATSLTFFKNGTKYRDLRCVLHPSTEGEI